jgi:hypothetical protein
MSAIVESLGEILLDKPFGLDVLRTVLTNLLRGRGRLRRRQPAPSGRKIGRQGLMSSHASEPRSGLTPRRSRESARVRMVDEGPRSARRRAPSSVVSRSAMRPATVHLDRCSCGALCESKRQSAKAPFHWIPTHRRLAPAMQGKVRVSDFFEGAERRWNSNDA